MSIDPNDKGSTAIRSWVLASPPPVDWDPSQLGRNQTRRVSPKKNVEGPIEFRVVELVELKFIFD